LIHFLDPARNGKTRKEYDFFPKSAQKFNKSQKNAVLRAYNMSELPIWGGKRREIIGNDKEGKIKTFRSKPNIAIKVIY